MISYHEKDITGESSGIIIHGVNCQGAMGSGVAGAIKKKWPNVYRAFMAAPKGPNMLGQVKFININDKLYVANCYTQEFYGHDGKKYANLEAVKLCLEQVFVFALASNLVIKSPKIGCGLGGLDWETEVKPIFQALDEKVTKINRNIDIQIFQI